MPMTMLNKELVAVAISVAAGCRPCTTYHLAKVREAGACPGSTNMFGVREE
jgi:AhpD family alkylhydroperoxidase